MTTLPHIALIGRAGAGKTTAAELLVKHFGYERLSFATPLKVMLGTTTDRDRMQEFGTDVVRAYEPDAWVNMFVYSLNNHVPATARVVVDDCRFPNEAQALKVEGFVIVRVDANRGTRVLRLRANGKLQDEAQLEHESETALDDIVTSYTLFNNGDQGELLEGLTKLVNRERS